MDTVGVEVRIQVVDPDGDYAWIGTSTTDSYGNYAYSFMPQKEGQYTIIATFDGTEAYWKSETATYMSVGPAQMPYPTPEPYPGYQGPSAQEVADRVMDDLPEDPTPEQISNAVIAQFPEFPDPTVVPEYTTIDIVIIIAVIAVAVLVVYTLITVKKQK
jgi:hypothetical protein